MRPILFFAAVALLSAGVPGDAQQGAPAPRPITEAVRVNIVNVEVFVTDASGRPVTDLTPDDFVVEEDGRPVTLTNFFAGHGPEAPPTAAPADQAALLPEPTLPPAEEQRLNLVVFVDNGNISQTGRAAVFEQVRKLLKEGTRPGDRIGLVSFDRSLKEDQAFTEQPEVALAALEEMSRHAAEGTFLASEKSYLQRQMASLEGTLRVSSGRTGPISDTSTEAMAMTVLQSIDSFNERSWQLYKSIAAGLVRFVDSLAGLPGRKMLCYVSEGLPLRAGQELYEEWGAKFPTLAARMNLNPVMQSARFNLTPEFREVIHHANAGRVTICSIDAKTNRGLEGLSAETPAMSSAPALEATATMNREASMIAFAGATGGRFLPNTPGLGQALVRMADDFTAYYSLGYAPDHLGDGKYHRLVVRVARAGVTVRHREGYLDKPEPARLADRTAAALLVGGGGDALEARVSLGAGRKEEKKVYLVPLTVTVPAARLVLLDRGDAKAGRVTVCVAAKDEDGRRAEPQCKSFDIAVPSAKAEAWAQGSATFEFEVRLYKGRCRLAVTARDEVAQLETTAVREVEVPSGKS